MQNKMTVHFYKYISMGEKDWKDAFSSYLCVCMHACVLSHFNHVQFF